MSVLKTYTYFNMKIAGVIGKNVVFHSRNKKQQMVCNVFCNLENATWLNYFVLYELSHEKTNNLGFRPGPTQIRLYSHRKWFEA